MHGDDEPNIADLAADAWTTSCHCDRKDGKWSEWDLSACKAGRGLRTRIFSPDLVRCKKECTKTEEALCEPAVVPQKCEPCDGVWLQWDDSACKGGKGVRTRMFMPEPLNCCGSRKAGKTMLAGTRVYITRKAEESILAIKPLKIEKIPESTFVHRLGFYGHCIGRLRVFFHACATESQIFKSTHAQ